MARVKHDVAMPARIEHCSESERQLTKVGSWLPDEEGFARRDFGEDSESVLGKARAGLSEVDDGVGQPGSADTFESTSHRDNSNLVALCGEPSGRGVGEVRGDGRSSEVAHLLAAIVVARCDDER